MKKLAVAALAGCSLVSALALADTTDTKLNTLSGKRPIVIGHRGASGYLPEHTLESYSLAIEKGADFIEPDLVSTKDGALIARHEPLLNDTTDVADHPEFASKKTKKLLDGILTEGWFACDFTLAEIKTLRAVQPRSYRPQEFNGLYQIPTLQEIIKLAKEKTKEKRRVIGIYPETKHPTFHFAQGLPLENRLVEVLQKAGWNRADAPVFIQSFEPASLKYLHKITPIKLIQLIDADDVALDGTLTYAPPYDRPYDYTVTGRGEKFADLVTPAGLDEIATYAQGIGPWKRYVVSVRATDLNADGKADDVNGDGKVDDSDKTTTNPTTLIQEAHKRGLLVHTWTFRNETFFLAADYAADPKKEYQQFFSLGVDGVFSDFPDTAVSALPVSSACKSWFEDSWDNERRCRR
ncbi:MAG TPA: glycerophosphodiester phosphodiesterase [Pseudomonadales bacterium]|nr:glycerophosphodiester phosphodiesterase [Pseudomonadales bacterium]